MAGPVALAGLFVLTALAAFALGITAWRLH